MICKKYQPILYTILSILQSISFLEWKRYIFPLQIIKISQYIVDFS